MGWDIPCKQRHDLKMANWQPGIRFPGKQFLEWKPKRLGRQDGHGWVAIALLQVYPVLVVIIMQQHLSSQHKPLSLANDWIMYGCDLSSLQKCFNFKWFIHIHLLDLHHLLTFTAHGWWFLWVHIQFKNQLTVCLFMLIKAVDQLPIMMPHYYHFVFNWFFFSFIRRSFSSLYETFRIILPSFLLFHFPFLCFHCIQHSAIEYLLDLNCFYSKNTFAQCSS